MLYSSDSYVILDVGKAPTPKWMPPIWFDALTDTASLWVRQRGIFILTSYHLCFQISIFIVTFSAKLIGNFIYQTEF